MTIQPLAKSQETRLKHRAEVAFKEYVLRTIGFDLSPWNVDVRTELYQLEDGNRIEIMITDDCEISGTVFFSKDGEIQRTQIDANPRLPQPKCHESLSDKLGIPEGTRVDIEIPDGTHIDI